jgi:hypothetical protein
MFPGSVDPRAKRKITSLQAPLWSSFADVWRLSIDAAVELVAKKATVAARNFIMPNCRRGRPRGDDNKSS